MLERLQDLREQAALERQLPKFSFRRRIAQFLHRFACKLERIDARVELERAQI
jgi:hypothetical protein